MKHRLASGLSGLHGGVFYCVRILAVSGFVLLTACASLPVMVPDVALEESVDISPLTAGNTIALLQDGPITYQAMINAIGTARDHINIETYIFEDDSIGQRFSAALIARQQQGVQVNVIHDSVGTINTPVEFFNRLSDAGINVLEFNPVNPLLARTGWDINQRDHRKLLVVDGRIAFLGGINISSVYSGSSLSRHANKLRAGQLAWRDTDLQVEGPAVLQLQQLFMDTWISQRGKPLVEKAYFPAVQRQGDDVMRIIGSSPDEAYSLIYVTLISALRDAKKEIWIANAYFVPDPQLITALKEAAARGVDVKLVLPGRTDSWLTFHAGRAQYTELLKAGVKLYELHGALLHVKTAVIDGVWSTVGSTNLDWRSFLHNQEVNAVVLGVGFGKKMQAAFQVDLENSEEITLATWQQRSLLARFKEQVGSMWAYWL